MLGVTLLGVTLLGVTLLGAAEDRGGELLARNRIALDLLRKAVAEDDDGGGLPVAGGLLDRGEEARGGGLFRVGAGGSPLPLLPDRRLGVVGRGDRRDLLRVEAAVGIEEADDPPPFTNDNVRGMFVAHPEDEVGKAGERLDPVGWLEGRKRRGVARGEEPERRLDLSVFAVGRFEPVADQR